MDTAEDEKTFTLKKPVKALDGTDLTSITLREPTAGQLREINRKTGTDADIYAVATIGGVPVQVVDKIMAGDLIRMADYISGFLKGDQGTGA
jgi:hypothetical protein